MNDIPDLSPDLCDFLRGHEPTTAGDDGYDRNLAYHREMRRVSAAWIDSHKASVCFRDRSQAEIAAMLTRWQERHAPEDWPLLCRRLRERGYGVARNWKLVTIAAKIACQQAAMDTGMAALPALRDWIIEQHQLPHSSGPMGGIGGDDFSRFWRGMHDAFPGNTFPIPRAMGWGALPFAEALPDFDKWAFDHGYDFQETEPPMATRNGYQRHTKAMTRAFWKRELSNQSNFMTDAPDTIPTTAKANGQQLDGIDLQTVLDSAANADQLGRQQFFTPPAVAAALSTVLPTHRPVFVDLTMGAGGLMLGAASPTCIGVDIDPRCARTKLAIPTVDGKAAVIETAAADITKLYPLLSEVNWQMDLCGLNPPFSLQWFTDRLADLANSEVEAVRQTFKPGKETIDSTLATMLIALDRLTESGEGYMICNEATARRLLGDPDGATPSPLMQHVWLWLTLPPGVFENVRDFDTAVIYFARSHNGDSPLHLTASSADPQDIERTLSTARRNRAVLRKGRSIYYGNQEHRTTLSLFRTAAAEYRRLARTDAKPEYNLWLSNSGYINRHLTPFQSFSGKIPKDLVATLNDIQGQTPMSLVVQKPTRIALLKAVNSKFWLVQPELLAAVEKAISEYHGARAPFYPMNDTQRIGFLDEEDSIVCKAAIGNSIDFKGSELVSGFTPGKSYPLETQTRQIERDDTRPNILGKYESVTLHGQELVIRIQDDNSEWWEFATFTEQERQNAPFKRPLEDLAAHFHIPEVRDVAQVHPEAYQANLARIAELEARLAATPRQQPARHFPSGGFLDGSIASLSQPAKNDTLTFREYQRDDLARFCIHDGGVFAWDKGLGKTVALFTFAYVKNAKRTLIVAPGSLHAQIIEEGLTKFGVVVTPLDSQETFHADANLRRVMLDRLNGVVTADDVPRFWITSYTALGLNGGDEWTGKENEDGECEVSKLMQANRERHPKWTGPECDENIGKVSNGIRCLLRPSLATLVADLFDCVACDEAVRLKADDSYISLGVRATRPKYRLVLTGTPIKNHLDDIFWLCHWSCGGHAEPCARWPYANTNAAREEFANGHMFIEQNHTKEEEAAERGRRRTFKRRLPQICNVHRLWKLLAPAVLCRRKQDIGEAIVPKTIVPIRVKPGTAQKAVYSFHVQNPPDFAKNGKPMNPVAQIVAQLQNLRQAALFPRSGNLSSAHIRLHRVREILIEESQPDRPKFADAIKARHSAGGNAATDKALKVARLGERTPFANEAATALAMVERMIAGTDPINLDALFKAAPNLMAKLEPAVVIETNVKSARSWTDHNPKQAATLKLIEELLSKGEQVVVATSFTEAGDALYARLIEAGVSAVLLDGKKTPEMRGQLVRQFKRRKFSVLIGSDAMSEGHSLECCAHLVRLSKHWAMDVNSQWEDRVHRLNSPKPVTIYDFVTEGTIDERLESVYAEKGDSASLALFAELTAGTKGEINLGQLLQDAIRNFDANAETIDELDIEKEWETSLKGKLRLAEARFREWYPPIVADIDGEKVTKAEVKKAVQLADVTPVCALTKGIKDATFGALIESRDADVIAQVRAAFDAHCLAGKFTDWRVAWRAFDPSKPTKPAAAEPEPTKAQSAFAQAMAAIQLL